jgi:hypothetical protein
MKRITSLGIGVVLVAALAIPAAPASAHHGKRGHKTGHHVKFHKRGHHRVRISDDADKRIGTIASFADGVLTIKLDGGKTVEGLVTDQTWIKIKTLRPPTPEPTVTKSTARASHHGDDDEGDDDGDRNDGDRFGSYPGSGDYPGGDDHRGDCGHKRGQPGTTADLVAGAVVRAADVVITKDGLVFTRIVIVKS